MHDYRSLSYGRYGKLQLNYAKLIKAYKRRIGRKINILKDWSCLDIACGYGNFLSYLKSIGVVDYTGIDSAKNAVAMAGAEVGTTHVECSDVFLFLENNKRKYDFISALDFIEHLKKEELFNFFSLLKDVQDEGGYLLLRTPNACGLFGMAARYNDITHEISFTPSSIGDVLEHNGYQIIRIWEDGPAYGSLPQTVQFLAWSVVKTSIRLINAVETGTWGDGVLARNMWILAEKRR